MNVLLITFSFPPAGGVGVLRATSLARYLPESGIRLDVLTARNAPAVGKDLRLLAQVPPAVTIHRTWTLDLPFALRKAVKRVLSRRAPAQQLPPQQPPAAQPAETPARPSLAGRLRTLIGNLLLPDPQVGWLPFALPAARRIIRQRHIDAVIVTVPPFSSVRLVTGLRAAFPTLPLLLDFRDEWLSTTMHLVSFNANARARTVASRAEADSVHAATAVVAVTEAARLEIMGRYPAEDPAKFHLVPNGYDTPATQPSTPAQAHPGKVVLTYIGTVYGSTDPSAFVAAVHQLPPALRARLHLRFIGHIETDALRASLLTLGPTLELVGFLPQAQALAAIASTDYLLLITHDPINVAAKFYDYLGGGKPIVAAVHPSGDVRRLLGQTRAGVWSDSSDPAAIAAMLTRLLADPPPPLPTPDSAEIARYHRRALAERYATLLRQVSQPTS